MVLGVLQRGAVDFRVLTLRQLAHPHHPWHRHVRGVVGVGDGGGVSVGGSGGGVGGEGGRVETRPVAVKVKVVGHVMQVLVPLVEEVQLARTLSHTRVVVVKGFSHAVLSC